MILYQNRIILKEILNISNSSEWKIDRLIYIRFFDNRFFSSLMHRISIDINCLIWCCGACIFTVSATHTDLLVNFRNNQISFIGNHIHGFCGAAFRACSAGCLFGFDNTVILYKNCLAKLCKLFCFNNKRF